MCALASLQNLERFETTVCEWTLLDDDNFNVRRILETDKQDD